MVLLIRGSNFSAVYHSVLEYVDRAMPIFRVRAGSEVTRRFGHIRATVSTMPLCSTPPSLNMTCEGAGKKSHVVGVYNHDGVRPYLISH